MNKKINVKLLSRPTSKGLSESYPYQEVFNCKFEFMEKILECNVQEATNESPFTVENYYDGKNLFFVESEINIEALGSHLCREIIKGTFGNYTIGDTYTVEFDKEGYIVRK